MKTKIYPICEACNKPIEPNKGVAVEGNIYLLGEETKFTKDIIGGNIPDRSTAITLSIKSYHAVCIVNLLLAATNNQAYRSNQIGELFDKIIEARQP